MRERAAYKREVAAPLRLLMFKSIKMETSAAQIVAPDYRTVSPSRSLLNPFARQPPSCSKGPALVKAQLAKNASASLIQLV